MKEMNERKGNRREKGENEGKERKERKGNMQVLEISVYYISMTSSINRWPSSGVSPVF